MYFELVLAYAIFLYDVCEELQEARTILEEVLTTVNHVFVYSDEAYHSQCVHHLRKIRDQLVLWKSEELEHKA